MEFAYLNNLVFQRIMSPLSPNRDAHPLQFPILGLHYARSRGRRRCRRGGGRFSSSISTTLERRPFPFAEQNVVHFPHFGVLVVVIGIIGTPASPSPTRGGGRKSRRLREEMARRRVLIHILTIDCNHAEKNENAAHRGVVILRGGLFIDTGTTLSRADRSFSIIASHFHSLSSLPAHEFVTIWKVGRVNIYISDSLDGLSI